MAGVILPPQRAVAASMRHTAANWPSPGLEPSRLGKFRVVCRRLRPLWAGTSPAPKQGPQKLGLMTAPLCSRSAVAPIFVSSRLTGTLVGYTSREKYPSPQLPWRRMSAASVMLSKRPPAHPAITPWSAQTPPSWIFCVRFTWALGQRPRASASTFARSSGALSKNSRMVQALEGWKGRAIMGSILPRSSSIYLS